MSESLNAVPPSLKQIIQEFQSLDEDFRLQLLLDYSDDLPSVPPDISNRNSYETGRVPECQTPVYLFVWSENQRLRIAAEVPPESPTVRGIVSVLIQSLDGIFMGEIESIPLDLLDQMGLARKIGSLRSRGITAIIQRLKSEIRSLRQTEDSSETPAI